MEGTIRPGRDHCCQVTGATIDAMEARGLNGLGQGHGWQDHGEAAGQRDAAQFLSAYGPIGHHFQPRRPRLSAMAYRQEMKKRFQI
jgi:hypothetical protein